MSRMFALVLAFGSLSSVSSESISIQQSGNRPTPNNLQLSLSINSDTIHLNLTKNPNIGSDAMVVVGLNGNPGTNVARMSPWNDQPPGEFSSYQDTKTHAAILAFPQTGSDGSTSNEYHGIFRYNNTDYAFQPKAGGRRKRRGASQYVATPIQPPDHPFGLLTNAINPLKNANELNAYVNDGTQKKLNFTVELFVMVDYAIFNDWYTLSPKTTQQDKFNDAINSIRYYYAQVLNGIDLRYSNINDTMFGIRVKLAGYYIATNQTASPWTEGSNIRQVINGEVFTDAYYALDALTPWVAFNKPNLPNFDNIMLYTGNSMKGGNNNDGSVHRISGLGNIQAVCDEYAVTICRENGDFASAVTGAHELAHNLGSYHDGQSNLCNANDQYIMSPAPGGVTAATFLHPYNFSACSIDYIRSYLGGLALMNPTTFCLLQTSTANLGPLIPSINTPVGQFLSVHRQCQHLFGAGSYYCGGSSNDKVICSQMWCFNPSVNRCDTSSQLRAANGTTCGNKKWCSMSRCVDDPAAPVASDTCLSGDYRGDLIDCVSKIGSNPSLCYQDYYAQMCCASCQAIKDKENSAACPYGDNDPNYCSQRISSDCYDPNTIKSCCKTCANFYRTDLPANCSYGDRANWCSTQTARGCYQSASTCCATCLSFYTGYPGCEYGDKVDWCSSVTQKDCPSYVNNCCIYCDKSKTTVVPTSTTRRPTTVTTKKPYDPNCFDSANWCTTMPVSYCYDQNTYKTCCQTCSSSYNGAFKGCEYGDRYYWCRSLSASDCNQLDNRNDCCHQCQIMASTRSADHTTINMVWNVTSYVAWNDPNTTTRPVYAILNTSYSRPRSHQHTSHHCASNAQSRFRDSNKLRTRLSTLFLLHSVLVWLTSRRFSSWNHFIR